MPESRMEYEEYVVRVEFPNLPHNTSKVILREVCNNR